MADLPLFINLIIDLVMFGFHFDLRRCLSPILIFSFFLIIFFCCYILQERYDRGVERREGSRATMLLRRRRVSPYRPLRDVDTFRSFYSVHLFLSFLPRTEYRSGEGSRRGEGR